MRDFPPKEHPFPEFEERVLLVICPPGMILHVGNNHLAENTSHLLAFLI